MTDLVQIRRELPFHVPLETAGQCQQKPAAHIAADRYCADESRSLAAFTAIVLRILQSTAQRSAAPNFSSQNQGVEGLPTTDHRTDFWIVTRIASVIHHMTSI